MTPVNTVELFRSLFCCFGCSISRRRVQQLIVSMPPPLARRHMNGWGFNAPTGLRRQLPLGTHERPTFPTEASFRHIALDIFRHIPSFDRSLSDPHMRVVALRDSVGRERLKQEKRFDDSITRLACYSKGSGFNPAQHGRVDRVFRMKAIPSPHGVYCVHPGQKTSYFKLMYARLLDLLHLRFDSFHFRHP